MRLIFLIVSIALCSQALTASSVSKLLKRAAQIQESNPDSCIYISQKVLTLIANDQIVEKGTSYWNLAQAYLYKHQYHTSLFYALKGTELYAAKDTAFMHQRILETIGWLYYDIGNYQQAAPYHGKALEIAQLRNDLPSEIVYTNALGLDALSAKQNQKALGYFQKALFLLDTSDKPHKSLKSTVQNNMGIVYTRYEDWTKAESFLLQSIDNNRGHTAGLLETYSLLAKVYLRTSQYEKCHYYLLEAEELSYLTTYSFSLMEYYEIRSEYEKTIGNFRLAFRYQNKYLQLYNKVNNKGIQDVMNYLLGTQEEKIKQDELLIQQAEKLENSRLLIIGILIVFSTVVLLISYIVFKSKVEKARLRQQLLRQELQKKEEQEAELSNKLAFKNEAIETLALTISKRNELVKTVAESVNKSNSAEVKEAWRVFEQALSQDSTNQLSDEFVEDFRFRLKSKYASLTDKELQLIIDIRNNLTSKELADKYHVEVKSIEMSRYRLRKKLHLDKGIQLKEFIMKL
ncbi:tetratricopeptide repeat protein [Carboxylicivirga sp. M1479]|uniref:tetratricopeptide repeat protein n=1 Tax=Carboxylicivirga sp. M1479 TaxID=2594476 RepID=UPI001177FEFB|nr:tetratricopeptide repeat protein [Carboxylicivirga sp. M1479]TRX71406.1 tetratricopeptide repeat protein [Carboxylicivirga sp. M1479]